MTRPLARRSCPRIRRRSCCTLVGVIATCSGLDAPARAAPCPMRAQDPPTTTHEAAESKVDERTDKRVGETAGDKTEEPRDLEPVYSRWLAPGYTPEGLDLTGYEINEIAHPWNPYHQNPLKGDF